MKRDQRLGAELRLTLLAFAVNAQIKKLSEERLAKLNLPADVNKEQKLASLERQLKEQTLKVSAELLSPFHLADTPLQIANGLVAKMDSVRFLRFFGGTVNILLARMYEQGQSFRLLASSLAD